MEQPTDTNKVRAISEARIKEPKRASVIQIPELYRLPMGDRGKQGCMKARV